MKQTFDFSLLDTQPSCILCIIFHFEGDEDEECLAEIAKKKSKCFSWKSDRTAEAKNVDFVVGTAQEFENLKEPTDFFNYFFKPEMISFLAIQSRQYAEKRAGQLSI